MSRISGYMFHALGARLVLRTYPQTHLKALHRKSSFAGDDS
jgi:hypothetical protein